MEATRFVLERGAVAVEACAVHDKIHVQSVARLFADAIHAIHDGSSVSRLFR
jgi:phosphoribosylpyrophosphate synthetase